MLSVEHGKGVIIMDCDYFHACTEFIKISFHPGFPIYEIGIVPVLVKCSDACGR